MAYDQIQQFWPQIPFNMQGANLCEYRSAYSHTRLGYLNELARLSRQISSFPTYSSIGALTRFNEVYELNMAYAARGLGKTLESSFKAFINDYYRNLRPRTRNLEFSYGEQILTDILRGGVKPSEDTIDLVALGHYSFSPNCNGTLYVTLELVDLAGTSRTYQATGHVSVVMSKIASKIFEDYQRTQFPSTINYRGKELILLGGANGDIDSVFDLRSAQEICYSMGARLPSSEEYAFINAIGSWSGGISLGDTPWALNYPNLYAKYNGRYQVRNRQFYPPQNFKYICVR